MLPILGLLAGSGKMQIILVVVIACAMSSFISSAARMCPAGYRNMCWRTGMLLNCGVLIYMMVMMLM